MKAPRKIRDGKRRRTGLSLRRAVADSTGLVRCELRNLGKVSAITMQRS
jgi:hypothetical protein